MVVGNDDNDDDDDDDDENEDDDDVIEFGVDGGSDGREGVVGWGLIGVDGE